MFITQVFDNLLDNQFFYIDIDNMLGDYLLFKIKLWFQFSFQKLETKEAWVNSRSLTYMGRFIRTNS